MIAKTCA
jgi:hypothetical protein